MYGAQADIETLYGLDALNVAWRDALDAIDGAAVTRALQSAAAEIDAYLAARYTLPFAETPDLLVQLSVDIALYRLASSADLQTEEHRTRYEDATQCLKDLSSGKAKLVLPVEPGAEAPEFDAPQPIVSAGPERVFTRDKMREF